MKLWMDRNQIVSQEHHLILSNFCNILIDNFPHSSTYLFFHPSFIEGHKREINVKWYLLHVNSFKLNIDGYYHTTMELNACGRLIRDCREVYIC